MYRGRVRNISEIKVNNESISSAVEMAEVFNDFFATIGSNLASEIQPSTIEPEFYLQPTDTIFSLKPPSTSTVCRLLNQLDTNKATGLDRIPCKLLKLSSSIVGPSLAYIFKCCIDAETFPNEWKIAKVTPLFKKGSKRELGNYRPISVLPLVSKIFANIIYRQLYDLLYIFLSVMYIVCVFLFQPRAPVDSRLAIRYLIGLPWVFLNFIFK